MIFDELRQILVDLELEAPHVLIPPMQFDDFVINDISSDSREVTKHSLFASFTEHKENAARFITQAIDMGVRVIILSETVFNIIPKEVRELNVYWIVSRLPRKLFAKIAGSFYKEHPNNYLAVTGTAGKTSVANFVMQLWHHLGISSISVGTLGILKPNQKPNYAPSLTTGEIDVLHKTLHEVKLKEGVDHVVLEASSHGLDQYRLDGLSFKVAAFTNFSQDHLDYHLNMDEYFSAKARLFTELLSKDGIAVLNADIPEFQKLVKICQDDNKQIFSYGFEASLVQILSVSVMNEGQLIELKVFNKVYSVVFPLAGRTQAQNIVCAIAMLIATGVEVERVLRAVENIRAVPGRLEKAAVYKEGSIYIDYAHKPGALEEVLKDLRKFCKNKLRVVFGCGGERDTDKRKKMGEIAQKLADFVYITDDNPRSEDPSKIRGDILLGCAKAEEIPDRKKAIESAIDQMQLGDILVVAGKGHENYQLQNGIKIDFDDKEIVLNYLKSVGGEYAVF